MAKVRKDSKGRVLHKGETYRSEDGLYRFTYSDAYGKRTSVYSKDLKQLREKEKNILRNQLDGLDIYAMGKSNVNSVFDRYISTKTELRSSTKSNYIYTYNQYVREGFGKKKDSKYKVFGCVDFLQAFSQYGFRNKYSRKCTHRIAPDISAGSPGSNY